MEVRFVWEDRKVAELISECGGSARILIASTAIRESLRNDQYVRVTPSV